MHFCNVHFSLGKKRIRENTCIYDFRVVRLPCFFDPKKVAQTPKKRTHFGKQAIFRIGPPKFSTGHPDPRSGPKEAHSEFWRRSKGPQLAGHLVHQLGPVDHADHLLADGIILFSRWFFDGVISIAFKCCVTVFSHVSQLLASRCSWLHLPILLEDFSYPDFTAGGARKALLGVTVDRWFCRC